MGLVNSDTPMMQQFNALKGAHPDCILFFRAGDFYEMFGDDAVRASEALNIALTTRNKSSENPVPMAGVPYHACEQYLNRLTAAGFKVAIAEQMEDPAQARGVVRREVVRVVTPGTVTAPASLEDDRPSLLMALEPRGRGGTVGLALADFTTGQFEVLEFPAERRERLYELIAVERPREILLPEPRAEGDATMLEAVRGELERRLAAEGDAAVHLEPAPAAWFELGRARKRLTAQFETANLAGFGVEHLDAALRAAGALLIYLGETQKSDLAHLSPPRPRLAEPMMWLDAATLEHLEIFENRSPGARRHTLFAVLNQTRTPMGARLLRRWLAAPLLEPEAIEGRLAAVAELAADQPTRDALRGLLAQVRDLERTIGRVSLPAAGVADVLALRESLGGVQILPPLLAELRAPLLAEQADSFDPLEDIHHFLHERFLPEPSLKLSEGGYIGEGVIGELDALRKLSRGSRGVIGELEAREREATGIPSLKVRYNKVFGYYVEIPRTHQRKVPAHYARKQTLVNAERYTLAELEELEEKILGAEERIAALEYEAFAEVRTILRGYARRMQRTAARLAALDALAALAEAAHRNGYVCPRIVPPGAARRLSIAGGRHPVIERIDFGERFIPNDLEMSAEGTQIVLITGPNMAGKSTVMRQVALIQLMAQAGSFVPASEAVLPVVDRIFTRVGAWDSLARGQSTFMLEMNEAANILNNASADSLIVLDEIGRGTSTYDGISIAWAMVEHIHRLGALTLFATHYHELTQLAHELPRVKNFNLSIQEAGERLVFTRKLTPGEADKSYGIQVARLAGLPPAVVARAQAVMATLAESENGSPAAPASPPAASPAEAPRAGSAAAAAAPQGAERERGSASPDRAARSRQQLSFLAETHPMLEEIRALELDDLSPRDALAFLYAAQGKLNKGEA